MRRWRYCGCLEYIRSGQSNSFSYQPRHHLLVDLPLRAFYKSSLMKKSSLRTEIIAGTTTFFALAYIIVVNPHILASSQTGMSFSGVLTATVVLGFSMTLLMGLYAKLPIAVAPGMGVNTFFAATLVTKQHIPWPIALGMVFWSGVVFLLISLTPLRVMLARAIPQSLRLALTAGIGLFLISLGLQALGFLQNDPQGFLTWGVLTRKSFCGLLGLLVAFFFLQRKNPLGMLAGIASATLAAVLLGLVSKPTTWISWPNVRSTFFQMNAWGALKLSFLPAIFTLVFTDLFDSLSTFVSVAHISGLTDDQGEPLRLKQGLLVDAWATLCAGLLGTSSGTAYLESAAGIEAGGRTGLTSVVTALWFLPFLFFAPALEIIPDFATAPVLILVGVLMVRPLACINLQAWEDALPALLAITLIPLTSSITQGFLWGFASHVLLYILSRRSMKPMMYILGLCALLFLLYEHGFFVWCPAILLKIKMFLQIKTRLYIPSLVAR